LPLDVLENRLDRQVMGDLQIHVLDQPLDASPRHIQSSRDHQNHGGAKGELAFDRQRDAQIGERFEHSAGIVAFNRIGVGSTRRQLIAVSSVMPSMTHRHALSRRAIDRLHGVDASTKQCGQDELEATVNCEKICGGPQTVVFFGIVTGNGRMIRVNVRSLGGSRPPLTRHRMANAGRILVVEDHETERRAVSSILKSEGFTVHGAESADKAMGYMDENIDLVLTDLRLGDVSGIDLLHLWKKKKPDTQFIVVTGNSSINSAVEAIKAGAFDYIAKPINSDELLMLIRRALEFSQKDKEIDNLRRRLDQKFGLNQIIGQSKQMKDVFDRIQRAAPVDSTVLILGESGTGKELVAQAIHHNSLRKKGPFVAVNCAAVPATLVESELFGHVRGAFTGATDRRLGRFEQADGGTLFIDEIGDFEIGLQAKLLRVLETLTLTPVGGQEDRKVNCRVLAATSRDIRRMVDAGTFREDLFYRLNVVMVELPPLRDHPDDIPLLVEHFLKDISEQRHTAPRRVSRELMQRLGDYRWPGNIRELRNALESMMVLSDGEVITEKDLPDRIAKGAASPTGQRETSPDLTMQQLERLAITRALDHCGGNRTHAAGRLGISVRTLQRKLRQYEMDHPSASLPGDLLNSR